MKKKAPFFVCQRCGHETVKWIGKCPGCQEWNTFQEESPLKPKLAVQKKSEQTPLKIHEVGAEEYRRYLTGINEFDRVLGGGSVQGSLALVGGEPGIGKSTLLIQVMGSLAKRYPREKVLYVSGEESASQVADRAKRLGIGEDNLYILNETNWQNITDHITKICPRFLVLDSIQTTISSEIPSAPGTVAQIREVTYELMNLAKSSNITALLIGHITKEGVIAGPKILEHMVDTVIYFEGDQMGHYRLLRAIKNRFGNTNEVGIFEMSQEGLNEVSNPSQYFLEQDLSPSEGRSLSCIVEGSRTLFVEIQSLVVENKFGTGRRTTQGIDSNRLSMLVAVVEKHCRMPIGHNDIYSNVIGGIYLKGRDADLSVCASLISSTKNIIIPGHVIFIGEVGLTGEVRGIPHMEARLREIVQLNYKILVTAEAAAKKLQKAAPEIRIIGIGNARDLLSVLDCWREKPHSHRQDQVGVTSKPSSNNFPYVRS